ncbi:MAG: glycosyltransferase family 10 [Akkermansiaceae bacterium]|nr:glycosyltransferase family 10 [Akkermansiaceae bacterium]
MTEAKPAKTKIRIALADVQTGFARQFLQFADERYEFELTEDRDADFVIHSCGGMDVLKYGGVRIFVTGENVTPNFAISDYAIGFERMDFGDRYRWMPLFKVHGRHKPFTGPREPAAAALKEKTGFCAYVMSNTTDSDDYRSLIFDKLSEYKPVNSGGRWRNNVGGPVANKREFQAKHKFAIAFENCSHPGYLTEKFADAAASNCIPIYWGDPTIAEVFNPKAFINCHDYDSLDAVVERVREIDQNDDLYLQMMSEPWHVDGVEPESIRDSTYVHFLDHIFSQDREAAYRRNRGRWGMKTEQNLYDMHFRPHVHACKRFRSFWRKHYPKYLPWLKRR